VGGARAEAVTQIDDMGQIAADLKFMETLRRMRARFAAAIVDAAQSAENDILRHDSFYQFAEFFYAIQAYGVNDTEKLERLARLHNDHLQRLRRDPDRLRRYGLSPQRVDAAVFDDDKLLKLAANFSGAVRGIDQSDLARLLVTIMSDETCRKLVIAAESARFVERVRSPFGAVLVVSCGVMERVYGNVLREARYEATGS
jgi:hypothetical protein